jgi:hypothetical protein
MNARVQYLVFGVLLSLLCGSSIGQSAFPVNYDAIRKSVVFIYAKGADGQAQPDGTGFLILVPRKAISNNGYLILVTARHMVDPSSLGCPATNVKLVARFNKKNFDPNASDSGTVDYDLPGDPTKGIKWIEPQDDSVDIAYVVLDGTKVKSLDVDINPIGLNEFPKPEELKQMNSGSQIMSAGLFPGASGIMRNYPIFKFGYISSRPEEKIPFRCCPSCNNRPLTQWMVAASLVPGNSGSPIFFVPVGFGHVLFGGTGRASLIGVQSTSYIGWDVAGMAPIQFLIDSLRDANLTDADFSALDAPVSVPVMLPGGKVGAIHK